MLRNYIVQSTKLFFLKKISKTQDKDGKQVYTLGKAILCYS